METNNTTTRTTRIEKTYFRNNPRFGRTTTLIVNGVAVLETMGISTKRQMVKQWAGGRASSGLRSAKRKGPEVSRISVDVLCPVCRKVLPTKRVTEKRLSRTLEYPVLDERLLKRVQGRWQHKECK